MTPPRQTTNYYVCEKCNQPCDVMNSGVKDLRKGHEGRYLPMSVCHSYPVRVASGKDW